MDQEQIQKETSKDPKKSSLLGWISFAFILLGVGIVGYIGITALGVYGGRNFGDLNITLMLKLLNFTVILSILGFVLAVTALFIRRQKKGLAIVSLLLSILMLLLAGGARYVYYSVFEKDVYDSEFNDIPDEDLYYIPDLHQGEINFEDIPNETLPREEIEKLMELQEVDWPFLDEVDVPSYVYPYMHSQSQQSPCYLKAGAEQIENYILFGIDDNNLSDVIMVVSMDRAHKKIKLISIQRDSYVRVPGWGGYGYTKINHAYGFGQETTALATLNLNFKLNIKDYFTIHFSGMSALIDAMGGVDVYLDQTELNYMYGHGHPGLQLGMNHLNGAEALTYSRMRSSGLNDNEVKRTGRQREVLNSLYSSCKMAPASSYPAMVETFTKLCNTSVGGDKILSLALEAISGGYTIENYALINYVKCWGGNMGAWYFVYDLDVAGDTLYRLIYEDLYVSGYPDNELDPTLGYGS